MFKRCSVLILFLSFSLQLLASINPFGQEITISSVIRTEQRVLGEVNLTIGIEGELSIPVEEASSVLATILPQNTLDQFTRLAINGLVTDVIFEKLGFPIVLDQQTFELIINIPIDQNRINDLSLANTPAKVDLTEPSIFNGYINAFFNAARNHSPLSDTNFYTRNLRLNTGLNLFSANWLNEFELSNNSNSDLTFSRTATQFSYDLPSQGTRLLLGDVSASIENFQSGLNLAGIGIARNFNDIPTRNLRPVGSRQFTLERNSQVDVLIDSTVVQKLTLPAGRYDLNDIPLAQGNNNIELLIRDEAGNEERISFSIAITNNLIKQGEFEYAFNLGIPTSRVDNKLNYDNSDMFTTGFINYGLLPSWTLGLSGQYFDNNYQYGFTSLNAWIYGTTQFSYSTTNHNENGLGEAFRFNYATPTEFQDTFKFAFNTQYEYLSPKFNGVTEDFMQTPSNIQHNLRFSVFKSFFDDYSTGISFNFNKAYLDNDQSWSLGTNLGGPIFKSKSNASFGLNSVYTKNSSGENAFDFIFTLNLPLEDLARFSSQYRSVTNQMQFNYGISENTGVVRETSFDASVLTSGNNDLNFNAAASFTANRFNIGLMHDTRLASLITRDLADTTSVNFETSIAFSGTEFATGRPVGDSFAIVVPNQNLNKNKIDISPDSQGNAQVVSYEGLNTLISNLTPYTQQTINFNVNDLPIGYDLGAGLFNLKPTKGQAYQLHIGADATITLIGTLLDKDTNERINLYSGVAYQAANPDKKLDFFSSSRGRIAISGLSEGEWIIELNTNPVRKVTVNVNGNEDLIDDQGEILI